MLRKIIISIGVLVFAMNSYASGNYQNKKKSKAMTMKRKELSDDIRASVVKVLKANEELHAAFFSYDGKKVENMAKNLQKAIEGIKDPKIAKLLNFSKGKLQEVLASNTREVNNQSYHLVSMALIYIVNKYDVGKEYNAYSCPMVKKKWVQNSLKMEKVHNPYAPKMPHCGTQDSKYY